MPRAVAKLLCLGEEEWVRPVLHDQDPFRVLSVVLAAAGRTPPAALPVPRRDTPHVVFKQESVAMRAYVRQGDPSLIFVWYDDPPQEVCAFLQHLHRNALSASSSCSTSLWHSLTFALAHTLSLSNRLSSPHNMLAHQHIFEKARRCRICSTKLLLSSCNALPILVFLLYLLVAFSHLRTCPYA